MNGIYHNIYLKSRPQKKTCPWVDVGKSLRGTIGAAGSSLQPGHRGREVRVPGLSSFNWGHHGEKHIFITFLLHYITEVLIFSCKRYCITNGVVKLFSLSTKRGIFGYRVGIDNHSNCFHDWCVTTDSDWDLTVNRGFLFTPGLFIIWGGGIILVATYHYLVVFVH